MSTPYTKRWPRWLDTSSYNYNTQRSVKYYRKLYAAWPDWCANDLRFKWIYKFAAHLRGLGYEVHVDHIVPVCSDIVCGLHVPWNLEIITTGANLSKGNHWWPDHPFENLALF